jgi:hypothetical protein
MKIKAEKLKRKKRQRKASGNPPVELSLERIIRSSTIIRLEHPVAFWATTMIIQVFQ